MSARQHAIALRADASPVSGIGHVMRCLSLAAALRDNGAHPYLVSRRLGVDVGAIARKASIEVVELKSPAGKTSTVDSVPHASWAGVDWRCDVSDTAQALAERRCSLVVVDHYAFDERWHRALSQEIGVRIAAIDDLADRLLAVDLIVDHNVALDHDAKYQGVNLHDCEVLGGPRYALLGPQFASAPRNPAAHPVRSIGVFMGGADAAGWSPKIVKALREGAGFSGGIEIATTVSNQRLAELQVIASSIPDTQLLLDARDLVQFFGRHELHIGAGGGATWERCCLGAPTLAIVAATNQREVLQPLAGKGVIEMLDDALITGEAVARRAVELMEQPLKRTSMSARSQELVDGRGATRVAQKLIALCEA
jgi:UDP-2,4-diacetamido-2,4,6-trideoxy-beta-L-altropyranose hydrolase